MKEPLMCGLINCLEKASDKYLGDIFHGESLSRCVLETIKDRAGKIKRVSYEIIAITEYYRANCVGGAVCGLEMWKLCTLDLCVIQYKCACQHNLSVTGLFIDKCDQIVSTKCSVFITHTDSTECD